MPGTIAHWLSSRKGKLTFCIKDGQFPRIFTIEPISHLYKSPNELLGSLGSYISFSIIKLLGTWSCPDVITCRDSQKTDSCPLPLGIVISLDRVFLNKSF